MSRPRRAFKLGRDARHGDGRREAVRIDDLDRGGIEQVAAHRREQLRIARLVPGIGREILARRELGRIDEEAGDHTAGGLFRPAHQRQVALVQGAHGGDQADPLALDAPAAHAGPELRNGAHDGQLRWGHRDLGAGGDMASSRAFSGGVEPSRPLGLDNQPRRIGTPWRIRFVLTPAARDRPNASPCR